MHRWVRVTVIGLVVLIAAIFALLNSGELVTIYLGFTTLYRISLVWLVFSSFLAGMVTMMLISLGHDLRLRRVLREKGLLDEGREEPRTTPSAPLREDVFAPRVQSAEASETLIGPEADHLGIDEDLRDSEGEPDTIGRPLDLRDPPADRSR